LRATTQGFFFSANHDSHNVSQVSRAQQDLDAFMAQPLPCFLEMALAAAPSSFLTMPLFNVQLSFPTAAAQPQAQRDSPRCITPVVLPAHTDATDDFCLPPALTLQELGLGHPSGCGGRGSVASPRPGTPQPLPPHRAEFMLPPAVADAAHIFASLEAEWNLRDLETTLGGGVPSPVASPSATPSHSTGSTVSPRSPSPLSADKPRGSWKRTADAAALPPIADLLSFYSEVGAALGHDDTGADDSSVSASVSAAVAQFMEYFRAEVAAQPTPAAQVATVFAHVQAMSSTKRPRGGRSDPSCTPVEAAVVHHLFAAGTQPKLVLRRLLFDAVMRWRRHMKATEEAEAAAIAATGGRRVRAGKPKLPKAKELLVGLLGLPQGFPCSENKVVKDEAVQALNALAGHATLWRFLV
jgi:hypothetical protein